MFEVLPYSIDSLKLLLAKESSLSTIEKKLHGLYFEEYFDGLGAKTIVAEQQYIDRDYLEDFSAYYVRCFQSYSKKCVRLHFFTHEFSKTDFKKILSGNNSSYEHLKNSYLGFIVVKPLPETIIGRTCLKTYNEEGRRHFPITRDYKINLFGLQLEVQTLAFQEQDCVVAACATSALWSAFQGTGILYHHTIPSPVEITEAATSHLPFESRTIPSNGLNTYQMAQAIKSVGLEPLLIGANDDPVFLKSALYAYIQGRIPILMGIELFDISGNPGKTMGWHAVAITGFNLGDTKPVTIKNSCLLRATRINKLYVHDDQVGPFARMEFDDKKTSVEVNGLTLDLNTLTTSWKGKGAVGHVRAVPQIMLVPLYHKIRIPFESILNVISAFDNFIEGIKKATKIAFLADRMEWDIYLTNCNDFKTSVFSSSVDGGLKEKILTKAMPRFVWRATAYCLGKPVLDLLFDATDIEQGKVFLTAVAYDNEFSNILHEILKDLKLEETFNMFPQFSAAKQILEWFKDLS